MKKLILVIFIFLVSVLNTTESQESQNKNGLTVFTLNQNPFNEFFLPTPGEHILAVLKVDIVITLIGGNGRSQTAILKAGTLVILDKNFRFIAVALCGNPAVLTEKQKLPAYWKRVVKVIPFETENDFFLACEDMLERMSAIEARLDEIQHEVEKAPRPLSIVELKIAFKESILELNPNFGKNKNEKSWVPGKILLVTAATLGGAWASGEAFKKEVINRILGGIFETGNGTRVFGPDKLMISKEFNWTSAIIGGLVSGTITYFLMFYVLYNFVEAQNIELPQLYKVIDIFINTWYNMDSFEKFNLINLKI